jgi:hypothetical protein
MALGIANADLGTHSDAGGYGGAPTGMVTNVVVPASSWVIVAYHNVFTGAVTAFTDNGPGLTWAISTFVDASNNHLAIGRAWAPAGMASGTTITPTLSNTDHDHRNMCGMSISGGDSSSFERAGSVGSGAASPWSASVTLDNSTDMIVGATLTEPSATWTTGTKDNDEADDAADHFVGLGHRLPGASGSQTVSGTISFASNWVAGAIALKEAAAAAGGGVAPFHPLNPLLRRFSGLRQPRLGFPQPGLVLGTSNLFLQDVTATVTTTATIQNQVGKVMSATATSTATMVRQVGKNVSATATSTASIVKRVGKNLSATVTSTATMLAQKVILLALTATVTTTATIVKRVGKLLSATVTSTASIVKQVGKTLSATVTSTATLAAIKVILRTLTATVTSTASMTRQVGFHLSATATSTATLVKQAGKRLTATATSTASMLAQKVILKALTATVTSTATMSRQVGKVLSATATTTASVVKRISKTLSAVSTVQALLDAVPGIAGAVTVTADFVLRAMGRAGMRLFGSTGARVKGRGGGSADESDFDLDQRGG